MPTTRCSTRLFESLRPDMLQLHGKESPARCPALKQRSGLPLMKAIPVEERGDLSAVVDYARVADRLLFDARAPREATRPAVLASHSTGGFCKISIPGVPFMLSGGLDPGNVGEALRITPRFPASMSLRRRARRPERKGPDKIRAFVRAARGRGGAPLQPSQ